MIAYNSQQQRSSSWFELLLGIRTRISRWPPPSALYIFNCADLSACLSIWLRSSTQIPLGHLIIFTVCSCCFCCCCCSGWFCVSFILHSPRVTNSIRCNDLWLSLDAILLQDAMTTLKNGNLMGKTNELNRIANHSPSPPVFDLSSPCIYTGVSDWLIRLKWSWSSTIIQS